MPRYIDIDETVKTFEKLHGEESTLLNCYNADWIISFLDAQPTADVVEVVRCKDCKYFSEFQHCGVLGFCEPNEYCSRGERRKEDEKIHRR